MGPQMDRVISRYGPVIKRLSKDLSPESTILDVGCGPTCPARLFPKGSKTYLDPLMNSYMGTYAEDLPQGAKICAVAESIPLRENTFDLVICVNALDHMIRPDKVLDEIKRVMKEEGLFVLGNFLHPPKIAALRTFIEKWLPFLREDAHPYSYTLENIRRLIDPFFRIREEIRVYRKDSAMFPSIHREDWMFICRKKEGM
jgi:ubiquinone/menaquinone biosynthesis C-methylase UbiE